MRVAYVCADRGVPVFGKKGCSVHVQEIIRELLRKGMHIKLFAANLKGDVSAEFNKVDVYPIPKIPKQNDPAFPQAVNDTNSAIKEALDQQGPFDFVYERYSLWSQVAMEFASHDKIPGILEVNAPLVREAETHRTLLYKDLAQDIEQTVFDRASQLVCVSHEVGHYVSGIIGSRMRDKINVIPNGINPDRFARMQDLRKRHHNDQRCTIGFVGTLKPWHGISTLIEGFQLLLQKYSHLRLLIIGDGPEKENLLEEINRLGLHDKIALVGAVHPSVVPEYLSMMDIAVAPYPALDDFYFSPLKVYEYMAAGLPVIVSRIGQLEDLVTDQKTGLFFIPGNVLSLVERMDLLIRDRIFRLQLGQAAREKVLAEHTWGHVAQHILDIVHRERNHTQVAS